jgi:YHS domain-containing protein
MSNFVWCHGPSCHKSHTQDRIRGVKGSKVLRTKKIKQHNTSSWYSANNFYNYFCSQGCYNDFANTYVQQIVAIAPRTEALETPVNITRDSQPDRWGSYNTQITTVDNNGG